MSTKTPVLLLNLIRLYPSENGGMSRVAWILARYADRLAQEKRWKVFFAVGWRFAPQFRTWAGVQDGTVLPVLPEEKPGPIWQSIHPSIVIHPLFGGDPILEWPTYQEALHIAFIPDALALDHPEYFPSDILEERKRTYFLLKKADWICTLSKFSRQRLLAHLPLQPDRVQICYLAGNLHPSQKGEVNLQQWLPFHPHAPYLFYPANFWPHKRHDLLFEILEEIHRIGRKFHLVLAGHDPEQRLPRLLEAHPDLRPYVHYLGHLGRDQQDLLITLYRHAYALPFVSEYEGFGMPILEAMTFGCPVVTRAVASIPEVAGEAALYVPSDKPEAWVRALLEQLPKERSQLVAKGTAQSKKFTWERFLQNWDDFFHRVTQSLPQTEHKAVPSLKEVEQELLGWNRVLQDYAQIAVERAKVIAHLEQNIKKYNSSMSYWLLHGPWRKRRWVVPLLKRIIQFRRMFLPRVGVLRQYPPRPIYVPKSYYRKPRIPDTNLPTISIVTPSYNQGRFLEATIQSVLQQNYPSLEYIIQDGGSSDNTREILERYRDHLTYVESAPDRGQAHAINKGFARTTGEIMAWLNSDDILLPGTLWYVADFFRRHPEIDVIYGHRVIINEEGLEIGRWVLPPHDDQVLLWADFIPQESLFWRRRIWEKIGAHLDESFQFALDWDLLLRFQQAGARFYRVPRFLAAFRVHERQKTSQQIHEQGLQEMQRIRQRIHGRVVTQREIEQHIRGYLRRSLIYHFLYRLGILRY